MNIQAINDGIGIIHLMLSIFGFSFTFALTRGYCAHFWNVYQPPSTVIRIC